MIASIQIEKLLLRKTYFNIFIVGDNFGSECVIADDRFILHTWKDYAALTARWSRTGRACATAIACRRYCYCVARWTCACIARTARTVCDITIRLTLLKLSAPNAYYNILQTIFNYKIAIRLLAQRIAIIALHNMLHSLIKN